MIRHNTYPNKKWIDYITIRVTCDTLRYFNSSFGSVNACLNMFFSVSLLQK